MRLLILSIVVSGAVLLLLARIRFPDRPPVVDTTSQPLTRLAARASFEELATRVARVEASVAPNLLVLRLAGGVDDAPVRLSDLTSSAALAYRDTGHVPALRIDAAAAVASVPPGVAISGIVGPVGPGENAGIIGTDPIRHIARIRVPQGPPRPLAQLPLGQLETPTYVIAVEGTRAGLTTRPVFLGRSERFGSPRWSRPLLPLGGAVVIPGALFFTLDGEFLGCAVMDEGTLAIAGAADVLSAAENLRVGVRPLEDTGLMVQPLSASVASAAGAVHGVVVSDVADSSAASGVLQAGDVISHLDARPVDRPEALLLDLGKALSVGEAVVTFVRDGAPLSATLRPSGRAGIRRDVSKLETVRGVGSRLTEVAAGSPFARAGLAPGDVIVRAGAFAAPTPAQVEALASKPSGAPFMVIFRRGPIQRVTAVTGEGGGDAPGR